MKEIQILDELPIIFTRDTDFCNAVPQAKPGMVIILPDDAVLAKVMPKTTDDMIAYEEKEQCQS